MMTIKQIEVTVGEITKDYVNNEEQGVRGYGGRLDIRPPYQREFIYNDKEQQAVITTVLNGYPLNVMYWVKRGEDAECPYEINVLYRFANMWQANSVTNSGTSSTNLPTYRKEFLIINLQYTYVREKPRRNWNGSRQ